MIRERIAMHLEKSQNRCRIIYGGPERAQRAASSENTCKLRKQLPQFDNTHAANAHNTTKHRNALQIKCIWMCCEHLQRVSLFGCVVSICTICCQNYENVFLICWCFFYLHVFSEVAARWALSATVIISRFTMQRFIFPALISGIDFKQTFTEFCTLHNCVGSLGPEAKPASMLQRSEGPGFRGDRRLFHMQEVSNNKHSGCPAEPEALRKCSFSCAETAQRLYCHSCQWKALAGW